MKIVSEPKITKLKDQRETFTRVTYYPDIE